MLSYNYRKATQGEDAGIYKHIQRRERLECNC
jgi:hypothetical protein